MSTKPTDCRACGRTDDPLTENGLCAFCEGPNQEAVATLREVMDAVVEEHGKPAAFWSLDAVYDEYDGGLSDWTPDTDQ